MYVRKSAPAPVTTTRTRRWTAGLTAVLLLAAMYTVAILQWRMPAPLGADAPSTEFSAVRAFRHVETIAKEPHPTGTPAHAAVRAYLLDQLRNLGLEPQVQEAVVPLSDSDATFMTVRNVMARLPGTEGGGKALVLAAHYDSVPTGPGANDDGVGVAAVLEAARALKAGPPLKRDVILLITDGEEAGLVGARAWVKEHAWAKDAGLFLNFEMRGTDGPAFMFRVSEGNGALMRQFAESVPNPLATSLADSIFKIMPNDTDVSVFRTLPGVGYFDVAGIGTGRLYHSKLDDPAHVDLRLVQHLGSYAMGVARSFGAGALPPFRSGDAVWFNAFRWWLVQYPATWTLPLASVALLLTLLAVVQALRWKVVGLKELGIAFGALPLALGLMAGILWAMLKWGLAWPLPPWVNLMTPAYMALGCGLMLGAAAVFRRWTGTGAFMAAGMLWWAILAAVAAVLMPGGSYLFLWPLLFGLAGFGYMLLVGEERAETVRGLTVLTLCLAPAFLLVVAMIGPFYDAVAFLPQVPTALLMLVLGLCPVHLSAALRSFRWYLPAGALLLSVGLAAAALLLPPTATHPARDTLFYGVDAKTGKAYWLSDTSPMDDWTRRFVGAEEWQDSRPAFFPGGYYYAAETGPLASGLRAPTATLISDSETIKHRTVKVRVSPARSGGVLGLYLQSPVLQAVINGQSYPGREKPWRMVWVAPPSAGVDLEFYLAPRGKLTFRLVEGTFGLPPGTAPRPPHLMPGWNFGEMYMPSDSTLVSAELNL